MKAEAQKCSSKTLGYVVEKSWKYLL